MRIAIAAIARQTGAKSTSKLAQMRRSVRNGGKLPAIRVAYIDDTLREWLGRRGVETEGKKYFLIEGHHRTSAMEREGKKEIVAKVIRKLY